jgi:hypothetical protein
MFALPVCRFCEQVWCPGENVVADRAFCARCRKERRAAAAEKLGTQGVTAEELNGRYIPARHRNTPVR